MTGRDEMRERWHEQLCHELDAVTRLLKIPGVNDVLLQADGALWVHENGTWTRDQTRVYQEHERETIIGLAAHAMHQEATFANPIIEGEVTVEGRRYRFTGHLPPIVSAAVVALRKPAEILYTLADYEQAGIITNEQREFLRQAVIERQNILIGGGMGSGKSTLANALIDAIPSADRVGTVEDTYELQVRLPNCHQLHTTSTIGMQRLVRTALRMQLDRLCVGEVRGAEALDMLKAWNVGASGGIATIHANDARSVLVRLSTLVQEAGVPAQDRLIAEAVDLIVFIECRRNQRRVTEILQMEGLNVDGNFNLMAIA